MDEDVAMDDDSKPKKEDEVVEKYNLDSYDDDDAMPGMFLLITAYYAAYAYLQPWVLSVISKDSLTTEITMKIRTSL